MRATEHRLDGVVRAVRPDVIHAHSPVLNALPALRVGRRHGVSVVYEVRAFWEEAAVDHGTAREGGVRVLAHPGGIETHALRRADHVTTICDGLRADILRRGLPDAKVTVIPNAVDADSFAFGTTPDDALRRRLGLDGGTVIGFVGSFYAYEGLDLLMSALPAIIRARPEARVLLVGGGPCEAALKRSAQEMGLAGKVVFAGRVPHDEVQRYYNAIDVLAYPRRSMRLTEVVTPLKPLEAMAQGHVLVASDVGGHRELIRHGETGMLFQADSADALAAAVIALLDDRARWPQLRACGRAFVERERTWRASGARYAPIYERLAGAKP